MIDSRKRSLYKSITWRIVASLATGIIGFLITGSFAIAGSIMTIDFFVKFVLYYIHERAWDKWRP